MTELEKKLSDVLETILEWNEDYKRQNALSGDPYWVTCAKAVLYEFASNGGKLHQTKPLLQGKPKWVDAQEIVETAKDQISEAWKLPKTRLKIGAETKRSAEKRPALNERDYDSGDPWQADATGYTEDKPLNDLLNLKSYLDPL